MVTVAMNRLGKEMDGYLFASLTAAKDDPTGHSDQELAILPASASAENRTDKGHHAVLCWHRHAGNSCSLSCRHDLANHLESQASGNAFSPSGQRALSRWRSRKARFQRPQRTASAVSSHLQTLPKSWPTSAIRMKAA
jgi:hypothetical protein